MALSALKLTDRLAIPIESEPFEPVENCVPRGLGRTFAVGVLDAQQEPAVEALGVEPVEQRRARASDMQETGRRGGEAGNDGGHLQGSKRGIGNERVALAEAGARAQRRASIVRQALARSILHDCTVVNFA